MTDTSQAGPPPELAAALAGRFQLLDLLGQGGMGTVWRALLEDLGREVAVKVLQSVDGEARARFRREAALLSRLHHPAIIQLYGAGLEGPVLTW